MASSKAILLLGLAFALVLLFSSQVSARDLAETTPTQVTKDHWGGRHEHGHGHGGYGHGKGHGHWHHGKPGHGHPGHGAAEEAKEAGN